MTNNGERQSSRFAPSSKLEPRSSVFPISIAAASSQIGGKFARGMEMTPLVRKETASTHLCPPEFWRMETSGLVLACLFFFFCSKPTIFCSRYGRRGSSVDRRISNDKIDWRMLSENNNSPRYKLPRISLGGLIASKGSPASSSKSLPRPLRVGSSLSYPENLFSPLLACLTLI